MSVETSYLGTKPDRSKFATWAKKRQLFLHPDVAFLVPTKTMGLGVYVAKALKAGSTVVSCPKSSAMSPYDHPNAENPSIAALQSIKKELPSLDGASVVCLRLMAELSRPHSPWRTWLECCPRMDNHLFHLSEAVRQKAFYTRDRRDPENAKPCGWTNLAQQLELLDLDAKWQRVRPLLELYPAIWSPPMATWEIFIACMMQVLSRNFHREEIRGQEGPYLLPGVDFINHSSTHANVEFVMHGGGRKTELSFDVAVTRDVQRGEQIYYNYGELSEARLFVEFQFLTRSCSTIPDRGGGPMEDGDTSQRPPEASTETPTSHPPNPNECLLFSRHVLVKIGEAVLIQEASESGSAGVNWDSYHLADRLEQLHRFSLIDDEGLQIRPSDVDGDALPNALLNTVYLLTCLDDHGFQATIGKVTRHWVCPKTPALFTKARAWLSCRQSALEDSMKEVEQLRTAVATATAVPVNIGLRSDAAVKATMAALAMSIAVLQSEARLLARLTAAQSFSNAR